MSLFLFHENRYGEHPLHVAVRHDRVAAVRWILEVFPAAARQVTLNGGQVAMHFAAPLHLQDLSVLQFLHDAWPEGAGAKNGSGDTPLVIACRCDRLNTISYLLRWWPQGATVPDGRGVMPIFLALTSLQSATSVSAFCEASPGIARTMDANGNLPLHEAARQGNINAIKVLLQAYRAGKTHKNHRGRIPADCVREYHYRRWVLEALR